MLVWNDTSLCRLSSNRLSTAECTITRKQHYHNPSNRCMNHLSHVIDWRRVGDLVSEQWLYVHIWCSWHWNFVGLKRLNPWKLWDHRPLWLEIEWVVRIETKTRNQLGSQPCQDFEKQTKQFYLNQNRFM